MGGKRETKYPGVEPRQSSIRVTFHYRSERCRETLRIPPTPQNQQYASNLLGQIKLEIAMGTFDYGRHFPDSVRAAWGSTSKAMRLADVAEIWKRTLTVAASTRRPYLQYLNNHILAHFGDRPIDTIMLSELKIWRAQLVAKFRPKTVNQILLVLRAIFAIAHGDGLIQTNPTVHLKNIRNPRISDADPFTPQELHALLSKAQANDPSFANALDLWWCTGMRPGELIALEWGDVDWIQGRIHVQRAVVDNEATLGKTQSERFIDVSPHGMEALRRQKEHTYLAGKQIFLGATGKPMGDSQMFNHRVHRLYKATGVRSRKPYQFRHTYASMMLSSGERPFYVAKQMGHTGLTMLERHYGKWMEGALEWASFADAIQAVENLGHIWGTSSLDRGWTGGGQAILKAV